MSPPIVFSVKNTGEKDVTCVNVVLIDKRRIAERQ
jgi:hypothetical protein